MMHGVFPEEFLELSYFYFILKNHSFRRPYDPDSLCHKSIFSSTIEKPLSIWCSPMCRIPSQKRNILHTVRVALLNKMRSSLWRISSFLTFPSFRLPELNLLLEMKHSNFIRKITSQIKKYIALHVVFALFYLIYM